MNLHKFIFSTLLLVASSAMFTACDDDEKATEFPATLEIVTSSGDTFGGQGGTLQLLVNSNTEYTTDIDVDWIAPVEGRSARPVNGIATFAISPYDTALDLTPRTGTITLKAEGTDPVSFTVKQTPGELYKFEITDVTTDRIPAKGGNIEVSIRSNIDFTISVSDNSWISLTAELPGKYTFAIAENTATEPRNGVITFATSGLGDFSVNFMQDPFVEAKGITTATQLTEFAKAVNEGTSLEQWMDENEEVVLLADIDMSGISWTPIGNVTGSTIANSTPALGNGNAFKGVFNGNGHSIRNLAMSTDAAQCFGLFGVCDGATIKNLTLDSSCSLQVVNENLTAGSMYGFIAGMVLNTTIENCKVAGTVKESLINKGATKYFACISGITGFAYSSTISNCTFSGTVERVRSNVYDNSVGSTVAGIVGFARGETKTPTVIENCANTGYIYALTNRVGGVLGGTTGNFILRGCSNSGVVHAAVAEASGAGWSSGLRVAGVFAFCSNTKTTNVATVEHCTNSGTVLCEGDDKTIVGGLCGNPRCFTLTNGVNSGTIINTGNCIAGLLIGQLACKDKPTIVSAKAGGKFATAFTGTGLGIAPVNPILITADNYFGYTTGAITGTNSGIWTTEKVTFLAQ